MIVCHCHARTDRQVRAEGSSGPAGTACGGCRPAVAAILEGLACFYCGGHAPSGDLLLGQRCCLSCAVSWCKSYPSGTRSRFLAKLQEHYAAGGRDRDPDHKAS